MNKVQLSRLRAKFHTLPLVYSIWNAPIFTLWLIWWLGKINERNKFSANFVKKPICAHKLMFMTVEINRGFQRQTLKVNLTILTSIIHGCRWTSLYRCCRKYTALVCWELSVSESTMREDGTHDLLKVNYYTFCAWFQDSSIFFRFQLVSILVWPFSFFKHYRSQKTCTSPSIIEIIIIAPHANVLLSTGAEFDSCSKCSWSKFVVFTFYMGIHLKLTISIIVYLVMEKSPSEYFSEIFQRCLLLKQ